MNSQITTGPRRLDLENYLTGWKKKCSALVQQKARSYAGKKLPHPKGDDLHRYINFFKEWVQQCVHEMNKMLNVTPKIYAIRQLREQRDKNVFKLRGQKEAFEEKLAEVKPDADQSTHQLIRRFSLLILLVLILLATAEGCLSYRPFLYLTGSPFASIIISIVFAAIWCIAAHKFADYWNKGEGMRRFLKRAITIKICTAVFYAVAHLRALERACSRAILNNQPITGFFEVNYLEVIVLTLVGWLFFLGGVWLAQRSPSWSDIRSAIVQKWNARMASKLTDKIDQLEDKIDAEYNKVVEAEQETIALLNIRKMAVKDVEGYLYHMAEEFKEVNHSSRVDGQYPDCFDKPLHFNIDTMIPNLKEDMGNHFQEDPGMESNSPQVSL